MTLPKEPFAWDEEPDEAPVPLVGGTGESAGDEAVHPPAAIVEEAEVVVREGQDAIAREETDPAIPLSLLATHAAPFAASPTHAEASVVSRSRLKKIAVIAACAMAFAHGWHQGSRRAEPQAASQSFPVQGSSTLCEPDHCPAEPRDPQWKEVQHR